MRAHRPLRVSASRMVLCSINENIRSPIRRVFPNAISPKKARSAQTKLDFYSLATPTFQPRRDTWTSSARRWTGSIGRRKMHRLTSPRQNSKGGLHEQADHSGAAGGDRPACGDRMVAESGADVQEQAFFHHAAEEGPAAGGGATTLHHAAGRRQRVPPPSRR